MDNQEKSCANEALTHVACAAGLSFEERAQLALRCMYRDFGFRQYRMGKFEHYDLYVDKKDYLISERIITFTDTDGTLKALKPDVTLSIVNNVDLAADATQKLFYCENVYRVSQKSQVFEELMQIGLECLGRVDRDCINDVLQLAALSLQTISPQSLLILSDIDILASALHVLDGGDKPEFRRQVLDTIASKNISDLERLVGTGDVARFLQELLQPEDDPRVEIERLRSMGVQEESLTALQSAVAFLEACGLTGMVRIDCSRAMDTDYYNGIVFEGFVAGVPNRVVSGGQYDQLMQRMDRPAQAIGFAVYLDSLGQYVEQEA